MRQSPLLYILFMVFMIIVVTLAAVPVVASDLFRQPYSTGWRHVYRALDLIRLDPFPTGGGAPPKFPYWRDPAGAGIYYQDIVITTSDDLELAAWFVPVSSSASLSGSPTVILAHGLLESKSSMLHLVPGLHKAGYNILLFDFRGHGASTKVPTTVGPQEALDVQAVLDWLDSRGIGDRVGGIGMSLGASALVNAAHTDARLDALVLDSLFADWGDTDFAEGYRLSPNWLVPDVPSPEVLVPGITAPVLIIHGTADILENKDHAYRLHEAANEPKDLWLNDSGHAWSSWTYPDLYKSKVIDFLNTYLRP